MRLLLSRFHLGRLGALALRLALTGDEYCRAAEPLAVRQLGWSRQRLLLILGGRRSALISKAAPVPGCQRPIWSSPRPVPVEDPTNHGGDLRNHEVKDGPWIETASESRLRAKEGVPKPFDACRSRTRSRRRVSADTRTPGGGPTSSRGRWGLFHRVGGRGLIGGRRSSGAEVRGRRSRRPNVSGCRWRIAESVFR